MRTVPREQTKARGGTTPRSHLGSPGDPTPPCMLEEARESARNARNRLRKSGYARFPVSLNANAVLVGRQGKQAQLASKPWTLGSREGSGGRKPLQMPAVRQFGAMRSPALAGDGPRSARGVRFWEGDSGRAAPDELPLPLGVRHGCKPLVGTDRASEGPNREERPEWRPRGTGTRPRHPAGAPGRPESVAIPPGRCRARRALRRPPTRSSVRGDGTRRARACRAPCRKVAQKRRRCQGGQGKRDSET
jgi:hypothetical protein